MKFSNEAMRDTLMFIEEKIIYKHDDDNFEPKEYTIYLIVEDEYFSELFSKHKYTKDELSYTIKKMIEGGLLNYSGSLDSYYQITDMSFNAIQLLETIRPETIWDKTKSIANKVGNHTLKYIEDTAQKVAITATATLITSMNNPK